MAVASFFRFFMVLQNCIQDFSFWSVFDGCVVGTTVAFNPVKLILLIAWVYLCLYFVQRVEFSPLVPKNRKWIANIVTLVAGPILLFLLVIADAVKRSSEGDESVIAIIGEHIKNAISHINPAALGRSKEEPKIRLLDSSGRAIKEVYGDSGNKSEDRYVLDVTEQIVLDALEEQASDILMDPQTDGTYAGRFRIDGVLQKVDKIESQIGQAVINSIKAVSSMDISERRRPQDGAFTAKTPEITAAFRVASAGVINGEKLSVRVLNQDASAFTLENIGLSQKQRKIVRSTIGKPSGMILICGPTGSGKTTSLYAMLNEIDLYARNVITVEDPIECVLANCSQIEVNPKADITFAKSLRSILRQDPDVICVGEIRDEETAGIALRAAQTGHLVLATVHSDTNASALVRLLDLGVSPLLIASGLNLIISQRLVRKLCSNCKVPAELSESKIREFHKKGINCRNFYEPQGCRHCRDTGYRGRIGIYDLLILDTQLKSSIAEGELTASTLKGKDEQKGKSNLHKQGLKMAVMGITSLAELNRVVG